MSSTASSSAWRPRFLSVLLLAVTFLSLFGFSSAAPVAHASHLSVLKRADQDPFSEQNVIRQIRAQKGRLNFLFYSNGNRVSMNQMADANTPPGYYGFPQIFDSTLRASIGNPEQTRANDALMSKYMAMAARGVIGVIGAEPLDPQSFWAVYERPILLALLRAGKVTEIRHYAPGETDVNNYYATEDGNGKMRKNKNYRPRACARQGTCQSEAFLDTVIDQVNADTAKNQPKLPTDDPTIQAVIDTADDPADPTPNDPKIQPAKAPTDTPTDPTTTTPTTQTPDTPETPDETPDEPTSQTPDDPSSQTPDDPNNPNKPKPAPKPAPAKPPKA